MLELVRHTAGNGVSWLASYGNPFFGTLLIHLGSRATDNTLKDVFILSLRFKVLGPGVVWLSGIECSPCMCESLGSILSTT